jgi:hypothetical protein
MSYDKRQFEDLIKRVLRDTDAELLSDAAINLLLGTAAQESAFGTYLRQIRGPAIGAFQMEPATFDWLRNKYKERYPHLEQCEAQDMEWDMGLAIVMARLRYRVVSAPLPTADDVAALATYWKKYYNTVAGAGTVEEFVENWGRYVAP